MRPPPAGSRQAPRATDVLAALELRARALHERGDVSDEALALNAAILTLDPAHAAAINRRGIALIRSRVRLDRRRGRRA